MATEATLRDRAYDPLPLGAVEPRGWLRRQLELQAAGLTGHLDEFWDSLTDSQYRGGDAEGWEREPYYADGLVPLAHLLDDDDLLAKAEQWVETFLDWRHGDGWLGPRYPAFEGYPDHDVWPRAVLLKVLRQHHEATGDDRARDAALAFCRHLHEEGLAAHPLEEWAAFRWQDLAIGVHWLYEETGEAWLLDVARRAAEQGYDWVDHFAGDRRRLGFRYAGADPDPEMATHVVNNAMGVKAPGVRYRQSGAEAHREAVATALATLDAYHGQVTGLFTGDEHFAGRDPARGTELCAVVELMYSLEELTATLGDVALADRLERVAFNALPAAFTPDMWAHQYDQQANQVLCAVGDYPWTNGPDANVFGLEPHYGCCTANFHQGWPKFASHLWMRADDGLAAAAYAPSAVAADLDGTAVRVVADTEYPFADDVRLTVETDRSATFALHLRVPGWCRDASLVLPDGEVRFPDAGAFHAVEREWRDGDALDLSLPAPVEAPRRARGAVALRRGPLVFSYPVASESRRLPGEGDEPYAHREYHPTEPWNCGLALDPDDPGASVSLSQSGPGPTPFSPDDPPVELTVPGARVPDWSLDGSRTGPVPRSPTAAGDTGPLTLVPYGCTTLRVTEFPLLA